MPISDEEQKRIFAKNLKYYLEINQKTQVQFAKDLNLKRTTVNMWLNQKSIPKVSTIQLIADYFGVGKSDLVDEKLDSNPDLDAKIVSDVRLIEMIKKFYSLPIKDKEAIEQIITSLCRKKD